MISENNYAFQFHQTITIFTSKKDLHDEFSFFFYLLSKSTHHHRIYMFAVKKKNNFYCEYSHGL